MINVIRPKLIEQFSYDVILTTENLGHYLLDSDGFVVYDADKIPSCFSKILENGIQNIAITRQSDIPKWITALGSLIIKYELNGIIIYAGY
jgi:hypothetical protein